MAVSRTSLRKFLESARAALASRKQPLTFVIGNESADLDSLCSALLFAYLRSNSTPYRTHIPLCNIFRDDITLRPEFSAVLKDAGVGPEDVITLSELHELKGLRAEDTQWYLVDHNSMMGSLGRKYCDQVVGCIDHHADEDRVPQNADPRVIQKSASCMSLIVNHCKQAWEELSTSNDSPEEEAKLAHLALGPILIDSSNLKDENKMTSLDLEAVEFLESKVPKNKDYERTEYFDRISKLRQDVSQMSLRDVFRKDYKEWEDNGIKLGTSSVPQDFMTIIQKAGNESKLAKSIEEWGHDKGLDLVAVLTAFERNGVFSRELLLLATNDKAATVAEKFGKDNGTSLDLSNWKNGDLNGGEGDLWRRCWAQGKVENSRKQIAPLLRTAMQA